MDFLRIMIVVGARPNFMKAAPIIKEIKNHSEIQCVLIHTGQHFSDNMSKIFFDQLGIKPDKDLGIENSDSLKRMANIMKKLAQEVESFKPEWIVVVGDVDSTLAGALTANKQGIKLAHVEAGLRSFDRSMPEETNRILTDHLSDLLLAHSENAEKQLASEGVSKDKIHLVGNVMIDCLLMCKKIADEQSKIIKDLKLKPKAFALVTMHRPSNVDNKDKLTELSEALNTIAKSTQLVFPLHPRTKKMLEKFGLLKKIDKNILTCEPLGYLDTIQLMENSLFVITDSGGIQEETTALGVPCFTVRENTERGITVDVGTNIIVGASGEKLKKEVENALKNGFKKGKIPEKWDGKASARIVEILLRPIE